MNSVLFERVIEDLVESRKKRIRIDFIYEIIAKHKKCKIVNLVAEDYELCYEIIDRAIEEGFLRGTGKKRGRLDLPLHETYVFMFKHEGLSEEYRKELLLLDRFDTTFYLKDENAQRYMLDREILIRLNAFLRKPDTNILSVNERSYQIFGDEKAITGEIKEGGSGKKKTDVYNAMKKVGITVQDLYCRERESTLLTHVFKSFYLKENRNVLIIENKDTFWSYVNALKESSNHDIDMVVFGSGFSVVGNLKSVLTYDIDNSKDSFYYFGDLDYSGIDIYLSLKREFCGYNIKAHKVSYINLIKSAKDIYKSKSQEQRIVPNEDLRNFAIEIGQNVDDIVSIIEKRCYVPQEALNFSVIKEILKEGVWVNE